MGDRMKDDILVSKNRVRMFLKQNEVRVSNSFYRALSDEIKLMLLKAVKRAKKNFRSTVLEQDL